MNLLSWQNVAKVLMNTMILDYTTEISIIKVILGVLNMQVEKAMAPHSSTLAWKIPWLEEPGGLQSMGSLRVGHDWATSLSLFTFMHWRRKWQPTWVFLPGESQGRGAWWAAIYGVAQSRTRLKQFSSSGSSSSMKRPLTELFHLSNLFQMPNDHRMVDVKFLGQLLLYL